MSFSLPAFAVGMALARRQDVKSNAPALLMGVTGLSPVGTVLAETSIRAARSRKQAADRKAQDELLDAMAVVVDEPPGEAPEAIGGAADEPPGEAPEAAEQAMVRAVREAVAPGLAAVVEAMRENSAKLDAALERLGPNQGPGLLGALKAAEPAAAGPVEQGPRKGK